MSVEDRVIIAANRKKHEAACRELRKHIPSFLVVGEQLLIIRDAGIWLETHKTLEAFVNDEFGLEKRRAYQLIEAATVKANLTECTNGSLALPKLPPILPNNERQFREIAKAPPEQQAEVVRKAAEKAAEENRKPTAKDYKQVVAELLYEDEPDPEPEETEEIEDEPSPAEQAIANASELVEIVRQLQLAQRSVKAIKEVPGHEIFVSVELDIRRKIEAAIGAVKVTIPHAVCPRCNGAACVQCGNHGWVNSVLFKSLEKASA